MRRSEEPDWANRLRPLVLGAEPLEEQLRRRGGAALVAAGLLLGMALFLIIVFAGFGRAELGRIVALPILVVLSLIVGNFERLRRVLRAYRAAQPPADELPPGRPSSG